MSELLQVNTAPKLTANLNCKIALINYKSNHAEKCGRKMLFSTDKRQHHTAKEAFILPRSKVKRCKKNLFSCLNWAVHSLPAGMAGTTFHRSGGQVPYKFMDIKSSRKGSKLAALSRFSFAVFLSEHTAAPEITASPPYDNQGISVMIRCLPFAVRFLDSSES